MRRAYYPAGATLASIAAQINANTKIVEYSWKATSSDELNAIVMECNAWSTTEGHKKISASGCTLTKHAEDVDYQTTTAIIPQKTTVNVRRRNGVDSQLAGCDNDAFLEYYRENGTTGTDILPGSSTIIRESVFTQTDNPALVAAYPTSVQTGACHHRFVCGNRVLEQLDKWPVLYFGFKPVHHPGLSETPDGQYRLSEVQQ